MGTRPRTYVTGKAPASGPGGEYSGRLSRARGERTLHKELNSLVLEAQTGYSKNSD